MWQQLVWAGRVTDSKGHDTDYCILITVGAGPGRGDPGQWSEKRKEHVECNKPIEVLGGRGEALLSRSQRNRRRNGREGVTKVRRRAPPEGRVEGQTHQRRRLQGGKRRLLWMSKSRLPLPWAENAVSRGRTGARLCGLQTGFQEAVKGTGELGDRCGKECNWGIGESVTGGEVCAT